MTDNIDETTKRILRARSRFEKVQTPDQRALISEWKKTSNAYGGIYYNPKLQITELRTLRIGIPNNKSVHIPFDENSTTDDVQTFIDLLKVMDVHGR